MRLHTAGADLHGPGPLRRARGAFTPTKKMAAAPYGHQVNRAPVLAQLTTNPSIDSPLSIDSLPYLTRRVAAQYPLAVSAGPPNHVVNGGMQTSPAAPGVHPGVQPGVSESHGPTTAPTPRTAPPTSECPWGYPWGAPPAAAKKPPRAKKTNHCASGTPTPCTNSTSAPSPRHPHATPSRRLRAAQPLPDQLRPALLQGAAA